MVVMLYLPITPSHDVRRIYLISMFQKFGGLDFLAVKSFNKSSQRWHSYFILLDRNVGPAKNDNDSEQTFFP